MTKKTITFLLILSVIVLGLYFNIVYNLPTNWDDPALFSNPGLYELTSDNLSRIFSFHALSTYQPVRDFSYIIDFTLMPDNPVLAMHIHSIILYFLMMIAVWLFLIELFKAFKIDDEKAYFWACISTVIYAVHPVHVESVAWLYARKEPLLGLFSMLSLWTFIKARTKGQEPYASKYPEWLYYLASFIFLMLALLSKPTALVLPVVMLIIDILFQIQSHQKSYLKRRLFFFLPVFLIAVVFSIWLINMMKQAGGIKLYHGGTFYTNLLAVSQVFIEYIALYAATVYFSADYPVRLFTGLSNWQAWIYLFINLALAGFGVFSLFKRWYLAAFFIAFHYIFILPVSQIIPINQILTDRYAFMPSLSWCVLLGWVIMFLWYKKFADSRFSESFPKLAACALLFVIVASYSLMTINQTLVWRNSFTLWEHVLRKYPNSSSACVNMSAIMIDIGKYEEAKQLCVIAIKEKPYDYLAISNLALAQMYLRQYQDAAKNFERALHYMPDMFSPRVYLGISNLRIGEYKRAYDILKEIVSKGDYSKTRYSCLIYPNLAYAALKLGKVDEAYKYLRFADFSECSDKQILEEDALIVSSMGANKLGSLIRDRLEILKE